MQKSLNESGRSLLEMIAIFALMTLISLGGLKIYQWAMASHDAAIIHDDLMARGKLNQEGKPGQKKLFATDLFDKNAKKNVEGQFVTATRNGKEITASEEADGYYYSYFVGDINEPTCKRLLRQSWAGADRIKVNNTTYKISTEQNTKGQIVGAPECDSTNTIQVTFSKNTGAKGSYIPKTCSSNSDCPASRSCQNGICVDPPSCDCTDDQVCFQGECVTKGGCKKGNCCPESCSECDQAEDVCTKCQSGYYLVDGVCIECPEYATCPGGSGDTFNCTAPFLKTSDESGCYCPAGYVLDPVNKTCTPCPAGSFCDEDNTTIPENCPQGSYCPEGSIEPTACDPGKYCPEGSSEQTSCPAGTICPNNISISCGAGTPNGTQTACTCYTNASPLTNGSCVCNNGYPQIFKTTCVECLSNANCANKTDGRTVCDTTTHTCKEWCWNKSDDTSCSGHCCSPFHSCFSKGTNGDGCVHGAGEYRCYQGYCTHLAGKNPGTTVSGLCVNGVPPRRQSDGEAFFWGNSDYSCAWCRCW